MDEWADEYQRIPTDVGAAEPGKYRTDRTPYAREVMRCLSPSHPCRRVVVMGASQMLKTQVFLNWMGALIHMAPGNILALEPSLNLAKRLSGRISKTIDAVPVLQGKVAAPRSRDSKNTIDTKEYAGGSLYITTAGSAANLAEIAARYLYGDEIDRWERNLNGEGDPIKMFENRATTFGHNGKIYYSSSPTIDGASLIKELHDKGDQRRYFVPCPHCGEMQVLEITQLRWSVDGQSVICACSACGGLFAEHHKTRMLESGEWRATAKGDGQTISFHIDAMYMPLGWLSWTELLTQHEEAMVALKAGNPEPMQVFYNTRLAKVWDNTQERTKAKELQDRAEDYALRSIPSGVLVLTAAVDTQDNRLELKVMGWGIGLESWVIDHRVLMGDPAEQATWDALDEQLLAEFTHPSGRTMTIKATAIDSGGHHAQEVYQFCRLRRWRNVLAIKGASKPGKPVLAQRASKVDINWRGQTEKNGCELWMIGTDTAKDWLTNRYRLLDGPGAIHFSRDLPEDYFEQLTVERKIVRFVKGYKKTEWVKPKAARNEAFDLAVYNLSMAHYLGLAKFQPADWEKLQLQYAQSGLFDSPPPGQPAPASPARPDPAPAGSVVSHPAPRRLTRSGYLNRR